jgi:serine/threonine protein kinase
MVCVCSDCGEKIIFYQDVTKICSNCSSPYFLIEKKYALLKYIASGGFGSIHLALDLKDKKKYAIKKRISDNLDKIEAWNKEIDIHKSVQTIPNFLLPK